jgi:hypothetical protein
MIKFDENGYLSPNDLIETDLATIKKVFVESVPLSSTRKAIFDDYLSYNEELRKIIPSGFMQWIDGSFTTKKVNPNDIDIVTFVDFEVYNANEKQIDELRRTRQTTNRIIDGYFVTVYPENHKNRNWYHIDRMQWIFTFNRVKNSKLSKGFLQINF